MRLAPCEGVMLETLRVEVRPEKVVAVRLTVPVKPLSAAIAIVESALEPAGIVRVVGEELMEKSGPTTVTETNAGWDRYPLIPSISTR